jgi:hypothetical protein
VEREAGTVMVFVDQSAGFGGGGLDRGYDATNLSRRVRRCFMSNTPSLIKD